MGQWPRQNTQASILMELMTALGILTAVTLPLSFSFSLEQRVCRAYYYRAVAMEIVDGELEALVAGQWQAYPEGIYELAVTAQAASNLPSGQFRLTRLGKQVRVQWQPHDARIAKPVVREATLP